MDLAAQARAAHVDLGKVDLVLAAECVWLQELVTPPPHTHAHTHLGMWTHALGLLSTGTPVAVDAPRAYCVCLPLMQLP